MSKSIQMTHAHESSNEQYQQARHDVGQQILAAYRQLSANSSYVSAHKQVIRSAESALEATQAGYEVGTRNIVEVLNAQRTLFAAKRDYANARYDYVLNSLTLKALAGALTEDDIIQVNDWLNELEQI